VQQESEKVHSDSFFSMEISHSNSSYQSLYFVILKGTTWISTAQLEKCNFQNQHLGFLLAIPKQFGFSGKNPGCTYVHHAMFTSRIFEVEIHVVCLENYRKQTLVTKY